MGSKQEPSQQHVERLKEAIRLRCDNMRNWQQVETILRAILSECPQYSEARFQLARLYTGEMRNHCNGATTFTDEFNSRSIEAVYLTVDQLLQDVIRSAPTHPGPYYCFACWACYPHKKSYSDMAKFYAQAVSRDSSHDPQYYIFHEDVAMAASRANDEDLAVESFYRQHMTGREDGTTYPDREPAYTYWRLARLRWERERKDGAIERHRPASDSQEATSNVGYARALIESAAVVQLEYARLWQVNKNAATIMAVSVEVIDAIRQLLPSKLYRGRPEDLFVNESGCDPSNGPYVATVASQTLLDDMIATLQRTRKLDQIMVPNPETGQNETVTANLNSPVTRSTITKILNAIVNAQSLEEGRDYHVMNVFADGRLSGKRIVPARNGCTIEGVEFSDTIIQAYLLLKAGVSKEVAMNARLRRKRSDGPQEE